MDPYRINLVPKNIYQDKTDIVSEVVAILDGELMNRKLSIIPEETRVFKKYDVVELIATSEDISLTREINHIKYLAFIKINLSGVIKKGDVVLANDQIIGKVLGFDASHYPNHYNLVLSTTNLKSGKELDLRLNDEIKISFKNMGG